MSSLSRWVPADWPPAAAGLASGVPHSCPLSSAGVVPEGQASGPVDPSTRTRWRKSLLPLPHVAPRRRQAGREGRCPQRQPNPSQAGPGLLSEGWPRPAQRGEQFPAAGTHGCGWHGPWRAPDLVSRCLADAPASREGLQQACNQRPKE